MITLMPVVCFVAIGLCWVVSTPPALGIDESSHYTRMVGLTQGGVIGGDAPADTQFPGLAGASLARVVEEMGVFEIPGDVPVPDGCNALHSTLPHNCPPAAPTRESHLVISNHGRALPLAYVLPALFSVAGSNTWRTLLLGRLGFLLQDAALLLVIVIALRRSVPRFSATALGTLALCVTPLVAFQSGTLAPNGTEVFGVVAFVVTLLTSIRLRSSRWLWAAAAVGSAACWTRDLGAIEVLLLGIAICFLDPGGARWLWSRRRTADVFAAVLLTLAGLGAAIWQLALKAPLPVRVESASQLWSDLGTSIDLLRDSIGLLGWTNVPIDRTIEAVWAVAWIIGVTVLVLRAPRRARIVAGSLGVLYVVANLALISGFRHAGFAAQSRFTIAIPIALVALLVACQTTTPTAAAPAAAWRWHWPLTIALTIVALGQFSGLLISAHRHGNGVRGQAMDFTNAVWAPPGGWPPMLVAFALASLSVLVLPFFAFLRQRKVQGTAAG